MANLFFPKATLEKMEKARVSEKEIIDVFHNGRPITFKNGGPKGMEKRFDVSGYLIGLCYAKSNTKHDEYAITAVWKRRIVKRDGKKFKFFGKKN